MAISQTTLQVILAGFTRVGLDGSAIARRAGVPPLASAHVDQQLLEAVWREALRRTGRSSLPLEVGLQTPEASFGLIHYLVTSAATVGAGMALLQRSLPLAAPWLQISIEERGDEVVLSFANGTRF